MANWRLPQLLLSALPLNNLKQKTLKTMQISEANKISTKLHEILDVRHLTDSTFIIRLERNNIKFKAGQHINVGPANSIHTREYSIYSGENEDFLEILVKEVTDGFISPVLKKQKPGNMLIVEEAVGYFSLPPQINSTDKFLFIASGTGIAPFHSFIASHPHLNYQIIHGIRNTSEKYDAHFYEPSRYVACTSRQKSENSYFGRITDYLEEYSTEPGTHCYLCGNSSMIHDVYDILEQQGIPREMIHAEVYF